MLSGPTEFEDIYHDGNAFFFSSNIVSLFSCMPSCYQPIPVFAEKGENKLNR